MATSAPAIDGARPPRSMPQQPITTKPNIPQRNAAQSGAADPGAGTDTENNDAADGAGGLGGVAGGMATNAAANSAAKELGGVDPQQVAQAANKLKSGDIAGAAKDIKRGFVKWALEEGFWYLATLNVSIIFAPLIILGMDIIWAIGKWQKVELSTLKKIVLGALNLLLALLVILAVPLLLVGVCNSPAGITERIIGSILSLFTSYHSICKAFQPI